MATEQANLVEPVVATPVAETIGASIEEKALATAQETIEN